MKHKNIWYALPLIALLAFTGCMKPRAELDDTLWGDQAVLTSAVLFKYEEVKNKLGYEEVVTGYQNVGITTNTNVLDKEKATIKIETVKGTDLTKIGIRFSHYAKKIEPMNGAPVAGMISDFSKGPYVYRLYSADGTVRDWTITVTVAP
ncbi:DUF5018-related domain-containing protein [Pedobacter gandavensis]|uniref:DUF5018-related domain-containing protein n=1 Tax=Pedobacter gandavensis TaxID=2679963 RepID=UPI00293082CE|nr:hypothetical protein [Pedobacter gandavensis]